MASAHDARFPEESSHKSSNESTSNLVGEPASRARGIRASSTPALLQLSENEFEVPRRKTRPRSCPSALSEETPLNSNSNTESSEHEEGEPEEEQRDESPATYCAEFINMYLDAIVRFRNSSFIHLFQFLIASTFISAVVMGVVFADRCRYLPIYGAVTGLVGTVFTCIWMSMTFCKQRGTPCLHRQKFTLGFIFLTLVLLDAVDLILLCSVTPSFTKSDKHYCIESYYYYSIDKHITFAAELVLMALLYLPRRRYREWCCNCFDLQPSLPDVQYRAIEIVE